MWNCSQRTEISVSSVVPCLWRLKTSWWIPITSAVEKEPLTQSELLWYCWLLAACFQPQDPHPPLVNLGDWEWFDKTHTYLYKILHLPVHIRVNTKPWEQKQSSETELSGGADVEGATKTFLLHWKFPRAQCPTKWIEVWNNQDSS